MKDPFKEIYKRCNSITNITSIFPRVIDVELTNACNLQCDFCPTGTRVSSRKVGLMSERTFYKILIDTEAHRTPIRFVRWGEPFIHPFAVKYMGVTKRMQRLVHVNTNGMAIDGDAINDLIHIGIDSIKFSHQTPYSRRIGGDEEVLKGMVQYTFEQRGKRKKPFITLGTTYDASYKEEAETLRKEMSRYCDKFTMSPTRDIIQPPTCYGTDRKCPEVFSKLSVNWNGDVTMCCADWNDYMVIGNVNDKSIAELWKCEAALFYRSMIATGRWNELDLCRGCKGV